MINMTYNAQFSDVNRKAVSARWDPTARRQAALTKIEAAINLALKHPEVHFTRDDLAFVAELMGYKLKTKRTTPTVPLAHSESAHE